jgi:hypothetical protein
MIEMSYLDRAAVHGLFQLCNTESHICHQVAYLQRPRGEEKA